MITFISDISTSFSGIWRELLQNTTQKDAFFPHVASGIIPTVYTTQLTMTIKVSKAKPDLWTQLYCLWVNLLKSMPIHRAKHMDKRLQMCLTFFLWGTFFCYIAAILMILIYLFFGRPWSNRYISLCNLDTDDTNSQPGVCRGSVLYLQENPLLQKVHFYLDKCCSSGKIREKVIELCVDSAISLTLLYLVKFTMRFSPSNQHEEKEVAS